MTPNRAAAIVAIIASIVTGVLVPVLNVVHSPIAQAIVIVACVLGATAIVITWLIGWQKHEANVVAATGHTVGTTTRRKPRRETP